MDNSYPKTDSMITADGKFYKIMMAVPGCKKEDISVSYKYESLSEEQKEHYVHKILVCGKMNEVYKHFIHSAYDKSDKNSPSMQNMFLRELKHSYFSREFLFDYRMFGKENVKSKIGVNLNDGILTIFCPLGKDYILPPLEEKEYEKLEIK